MTTTTTPHRAPAADDGPRPDPDSAPRYTVDELAARTGVPSRTIRHYQSERVLPPPEKHGRVAYYRELHIRRLELIAQLQDRGLSLKAIRDALHDVERGRLTLEDWLGLNEQIRMPWSDDSAALWDAETLSQHLHGRRPGLKADLLEHGLVQEQPGLPVSYLVTSPGLLNIALSLEDAGISLHRSTAAAAIMRKHLQRTADELVSYFLRHAGDGFGESASSTSGALEALRPLSAEALRLIFTREVERALLERRDELAATLSRTKRSS